MKPVTEEQVWAARIIAIAADGIQIFFFPLFAEGFISPFDDLLDIGVCIALSCIIGFHGAFVPTLFIEAFPGLDEVPTWTLAVFYATHGRQILPPE